MTIEDEIAALVAFLKHPAGFNVDMCGLLCIRPVDECSPPETWEVDWEHNINGTQCNFHKVFLNLEEAAQFFVEKRHYLCLGLDFEAIEWEKIKGK